MRISCLQLNPQTDLKKNMESALHGISEAAGKGTDVIVLPEVFTYMGDEDKRKNTSNKLNEGIFAQLKQAAREFKINLIGGSHAEKVESSVDKVYNTCVTYNKKGEELSVYRKCHLFNLRDQNGTPIYCESDIYKSGKYPESYHLEVPGETWNACNIICYDLRFPEILRKKKNTLFDIIFVPAAFKWQTGKDHWEVLLRARAIENQCYVIGANQTGAYDDGQKRNYGHSMIIDPWGHVLASLKEETGILTADISKKPIAEARLKLPAVHDRIFF